MEDWHIDFSLFTNITHPVYSNLEGKLVDAETCLHVKDILNFVSSADPSINFAISLRSGSNNIFFNFKDRYWNSNEMININQWNLLGLTIKEGEKAFILIDKKRITTIETMTNVSFYSDRNLIGINGNQAGSALNARYKDLRIYDRFFTQEMLNALYDS